MNQSDYLEPCQSVKAAFPASIIVRADSLTAFSRSGERPVPILSTITGEQAGGLFNGRRTEAMTTTGRITIIVLASILSSGCGITIQPREGKMSKIIVHTPFDDCNLEGTHLKQKVECVWRF